MGGRQNQAYTSYEEKWWAQEIPNSPPSRQKRPRQRGQTLPDQLKGRPAQSRVQRRKAQALSRFLMYMTLAVLAAWCFPCGMDAAVGSTFALTIYGAALALTAANVWRGSWDED